MKVILFHNTLPAYRIPFYNALAKLVELKIVLFNLESTEVIYGEKSKPALLKGCRQVIIDKSKDVRKQVKDEISEGADIVHLPTPDGKYELYVTNLCLRFARKKGIKTALYWIRWTPDLSQIPVKQIGKNVIRNILAGGIARKADVCIYSGVKSREQFKRLRVRDDHLMPMHYSTDVYQDAEDCDIYEKYGIRDGLKLILYFGRVIERKGLLYLIRAYEMLNEAEVQLVVAGSGTEYFEECKKYVEENHVRNVLFLGLVPSVERKNFFENADLFILPSVLDHGITEPWGQTVNESFQWGCRVVASDAVGAAYELIRPENGAMYPAEDVQALADIMKGLLRTDYDRDKIKSTISEYTCENMAEDMLRAYDMALLETDGAL